MLGADGQRRYLIMFTTPAESRGITGFFGNYADVTIDNGAIEVTEFGRHSDLSAVVNENGAFCTGCPQEFVDRYGPYSLAMGPERDGVGIRVAEHHDAGPLSRTSPRRPRSSIRRVAVHRSTA